MFGCIETEKEMEKRAIKESKMQMKICCLDVKMKKKKEKTKNKKEGYIFSLTCRSGSMQIETQ
jgi:hypothetical protein